VKKKKKNYEIKFQLKKKRNQKIHSKKNWVFLFSSQPLFNLQTKKFEKNTLKI
jgi:hypothetical protein